MHFSSHLNGFFNLTREEKVKNKTQFKCKFGEEIKFKKKIMAKRNVANPQSRQQY